MNVDKRHVYVIHKNMSGYDKEVLLEEVNADIIYSKNALYISSVVNTYDANEMEHDNISTTHILQLKKYEEPVVVNACFEFYRDVDYNVLTTDGKYIAPKHIPSHKVDYQPIQYDNDEKDLGVFTIHGTQLITWYDLCSHVEAYKLLDEGTLIEELKKEAKKDGVL